MKSRLIIADDHPMVRQALCDAIGRAGDLELVATAQDGAEAEHLARTQGAELLILDITLPGKSGIKVLESLRADGLSLPILFFSMHPAGQYVAYVRRAGAQGFVGKEADEATLLAAIRRVLSGNTSFPSGSGGGASRSGRVAAISGRLSARENEVMQYLLRGVPLVDIAAELGISAQSVTTYRRRILDKLDVRNNAELISRMGRGL